VVAFAPKVIIACLRHVVAFDPKLIKCAAYGIAQGRGWRYRRIGGRRERVRRGGGFSSLMKQKKRGGNCAVFCFSGKRIFYIYDVITWKKFLKQPTIHYLHLFLINR
jgi:hypothetical protein